MNNSYEKAIYNTENNFVVMGDERLSEALTGDHHFEQAGFRALLK